MSKIATGSSSVEWDAPLEYPPEIIQMGVTVHGRADGPSSDHYRLPDLWCLHLYRYHGDLELDGRPLQLRPQSAGIIPPDTNMVYRYRSLSEHCFCHFRLSPSERSARIRAIQDLGPRFISLDSRLRDIALSVTAPVAQRQSVLWDILWSLASQPQENGGPPVRHPTVERAISIIERTLAEPISVSDLAKDLDVSYGYISRLFQAELGETVVGYIRRRRGERAKHLLRHSTLGIKSIAISVGVPDLQQFNRLIHRTSGCPPRQLRERLVK